MMRIQLAAVLVSSMRELKVSINLISKEFSVGLLNIMVAHSSFFWFAE
jgi:hypothetical protein